MRSIRKKLRNLKKKINLLEDLTRINQGLRKPEYPKELKDLKDLKDLKELKELKDLKELKEIL